MLSFDVRSKRFDGGPSATPPPHQFPTEKDEYQAAQATEEYGQENYQGHRPSGYVSFFETGGEGAFYGFGKE